VTILHVFQYWTLFFVLGAALALNFAALATIVVSKVIRGCREAITAAVREKLTDHLIDVLESDGAFAVRGREVAIDGRRLRLFRPRGLRGEATRETILSFIATLKGESRERLTLMLESAGYVEATMRRLHSRSELTRAKAASILGAMGSTRPVEVLTQHFLSDPSQEVRIVAAEALGTLRQVAGIPGALLFLEAARQPTRYQEARIANVLAKFGASVVPALEDALTDATERVVVFALDVLIEIGVVLHPKQITNAAKHSSAEVRGRAVELLGAASQSEQITLLFQAASDPASFVRLNAIKAMFALGAPQDAALRTGYFRVLEKALHDTRWAVRRNAAATLADAEEQGRDILQRSLSSESLAALQLYDLRRGHVSTVTT